MLSLQRVLASLMLTGWVAMVLACGGAGNAPDKIKITTEHVDESTSDSPKSIKGPTSDSPKSIKGPTSDSPKMDKITAGIAHRWGGKLGTGLTAYDELPEPWRSRFADEWKQSVVFSKQDVAEANLRFNEAKASYDVADAKMADFKQKYGSNPKDALLQSVLKDRTAVWVKAESLLKKAEVNLEDAKAKLTSAEKNDPPYFKGNFSGCLTVEDVQSRVAELEDKKRLADELRSEAEASRKAEDEYDERGLVLMRKTVNAKIGGHITGSVINRRPVKLKYAQIKFILYDSTGAQVGTALANINDLEPGATWNFKASSFGTSFSSFKFSELSGF